MPGSRPHFVLGDRFGASCDARLTRFMRDVLQGAGYEVQLNRPYAGGFITEYYGNPTRGVHALQLEINRGLYLSEASFSKTRDFAKLTRIMDARGGTVSDFVRDAIDHEAQKIALAEWDALVDDLQSTATWTPDEDELNELLNDPQCPNLEEHHAT